MSLIKDFHLNRKQTCKEIHKRHTLCTSLRGLAMHSCFSHFVFKIRLIRLGLSFQKQKILYLHSQPTDSESGVITITPQSQLSVGDTEKLSVTFSHASLILVEFTYFYYFINSANLIQNRKNTIEMILRIYDFADVCGFLQNTTCAA